MVVFPPDCAKHKKLNHHVHFTLNNTHTYIYISPAETWPLEKTVIKSVQVLACGSTVCPAGKKIAKTQQEDE